MFAKCKKFIFWFMDHREKTVSFSCQTGLKMLQWVRISEKVI